MLVWISDLGMKKGFRKSPETLSVELRGFEPLTLSMPWRCATSCAIAPKSALQTLYNIHRRHKSRKFRRVARTEELA